MEKTADRDPGTYSGERVDPVYTPQPGVQSPKRDTAVGIGDTVKQVLMGILLILIFIATLQLYFTVQDVIRTWFADELVPLFNAVFYICVIAGGILLIRTYLLSRK